MPLGLDNWMKYFTMSQDYKDASTVDYYLTIDATVPYDLMNVRFWIEEYGIVSIPASGHVEVKRTASTAGQYTVDALGNKTGKTNDEILENTMQAIGAIIENKSAVIGAESLPDVKEVWGSLRMGKAEADSINETDYQKAVEQMGKAEKSDSSDYVILTLKRLATIQYKDSEQKAAEASAKQSALLAEETEPIYQKELQLEQEGKYQEAIAVYQNIQDYKDIKDRIAACNNGIKEEIYQQALALENDGKYQEAIEIYATVNTYKDSAERIAACENGIKEGKYQQALALENEGKYQEAINIYQTIESYKDSKNRISEGIYQRAILLEKEGKFSDAIFLLETIHDYKDADKRIADFQLQKKNIIAAAYRYAAFVSVDGYVSLIGTAATNSIEDAKKWDDITSIYCGNFDIVGLKKNGTVVIAGLNTDKGKVSGWTNIIDIAVGAAHTVGLQKDGKVVAAGDNRFGQCDVEKWNDIIAIAAGNRHTIGLKKDGTLVATGDNGKMNVT